MQQAVFDGKAVKDMTPDMVRMALGKPSRIEPKVGSATDEETWIYEKSDSTGASRPNVAMGGGMGGIGVMRGRRGGGAAVVRAARRARGNSRSSSKTAW